MRICKYCGTIFHDKKAYEIYENLPKWLASVVILADGDSFNLAAKLEVFIELGLIGTIVHVLDEDAPFIWVVRSFALTCIILRPVNLAFFSLA